jgi:peroxisomal 3,2-trans-enoyl-CoA isomerase
MQLIFRPLLRCSRSSALLSRSCPVQLTHVVSMSVLGDYNPDLVLLSTKNGVSTLTMNDPKKLNGWTGPMMVTLSDRFKQLAADDNTKVMILTGADPYYCAGVNLAASMSKPMHPKKLHSLIVKNNQAVFDAYLDFPKPILIAANGPAIGACVTSASLCDGIIASEKATFVTPFARLGVTPEGCSSVHFERILGKEGARKMLDDGFQPTAKEAKELGLVLDVVPHSELLSRAQELAEQWASEGKKKTIPGGGDVEEYKAVNAKESLELADAFLAVPFLKAQYEFLKSKGKTQTAIIFWLLKTLRPLWSKLL